MSVLWHETGNVGEKISLDGEDGLVLDVFWCAYRLFSWRCPVGEHSFIWILSWKVLQYFRKEMIVVFDEARNSKDGEKKRYLSTISLRCQVGQKSSGEGREGNWLFDSGVQEDVRAGDRSAGSYHIEGRRKSEREWDHIGVCVS